VTIPDRHCKGTGTFKGNSKACKRIEQEYGWAVEQVIGRRNREYKQKLGKMMDDDALSLGSSCTG
jgi:hypothetical protein